MISKISPISPSINNEIIDYQPLNKHHHYPRHQLVHSQNSNSYKTAKSPIYTLSSSSAKKINIRKKIFEVDCLNTAKNEINSINNRQIMQLKTTNEHQYKMNSKSDYSDSSYHNEENSSENLNLKTLIKEKKIDLENAIKSTVKAYHNQHQLQYSNSDVNPNNYSNKSTEKENLFSKVITHTSVKKLEFSNKDSNENNDSSDYDDIQYSSSNHDGIIVQSSTNNISVYDNQLKDKNEEIHSTIQNVQVDLIDEKHEIGYENVEINSQTINEVNILEDSNYDEEYKPLGKKIIPNTYNYHATIKKIYLWNSDKTAFKCFPVFLEKDLKFNDFVQEALNDTGQDDDCDTQQETLIKAICQNYRDFIAGLNENNPQNSNHEFRPAYIKNILTYYKVAKPTADSSKVVYLKRENRASNINDKTSNESNGLNSQQARSKSNNSNNDNDNDSEATNNDTLNENKETRTIISSSSSNTDSDDKNSNKEEIERKCSTTQSENDKSVHKKVGNCVFKLFTNFVAKLTGSKSQQVLVDLK